MILKIYNRNSHSFGFMYSASISWSIEPEFGDYGSQWYGKPGLGCWSKCWRSRISIYRRTVNVYGKIR